MVGQGLVSPAQAKVQAVRDFVMPTTKRVFDSSLAWQGTTAGLLTILLIIHIILQRQLGNLPQNAFLPPLIFLMNLCTLKMLCV